MVAERAPGKADQSPELSSLFLAITEHAPLPMVTVEGAGHIVLYVNPAFCRLMNKPAEQLVGKPFAEILPEEAECVTLLDRVFRTGKPESHTEQQPSKSHSVSWSFTMWPVLADERPVGVMIQVTETVQFHEKMLAMNEALILGSLRQQELNEVAEALNVQLQREIAERRYLGAIVDSSDDAIIGKSLNSIIISWNKGAERLFGYTAQEAIGRSIAMLIPPDRLHEEPEIMARIKRGERLENFETVRVGKNHSVLKISLTVSPIKDAAGQVIGASKIAHDISVRKRAEATLRESEERFRALFELGPVAVYSCDASGVILEFNNRAAELWDRAPAVGDTDERFFGSLKLFRPDGSFMPHEQWPMAEVISGKIPAARDAEVIIERPDGSRVIVIVNIRPLKNERGEITGAINCFYDITERKQAEQRQQFLMNELAHRTKNLLAVVQSIASRSLSGTRSLAEAREMLTQRIQALARCQSALMTEGFEGAPVAEIIRLEFEAFSDQVKAIGPDLLLNPKVAQTFTLLVHELATNATKYGALSRPDGQVAIHWSIEGTGAEARFKFQWQERDGPLVVPPDHQGFGRIVLEKAAALDFAALPKIRFAPEGMSYEIDAPLSIMVAASAGGADLE
jgi:PAS domain S-box-containing protein